LVIYIDSIKCNIEYNDKIYKREPQWTSEILIKYCKMEIWSYPSIDHRLYTAQILGVQNLTSDFNKENIENNYCYCDIFLYQ
jgi:hypothetical protein